MPVAPASPYLNHFIQPDTLIPDPSNPQAYNRFGYVQNSPINFNDPTGHEIGSLCDRGYCDENDDPIMADSPNNIFFGNSKSKEKDEDQGVLSSIVEEVINDWVTLEGTCAQTGYSDILFNTPCLDYYSVLSQDMATASSFFGVFTTVAYTTTGCVAGSEAGILPGCYGGYVAGRMVHVTTFNYIETGFSFISLVTTWQSDNLTGENKSFWEMGEDTRTSITTFSIGLTTSDPFIDFAVDFYSSGYNHGYFCGVSTLLDCFP